MADQLLLEAEFLRDVVLPAFVPLDLLSPLDSVLLLPFVEVLVAEGGEQIDVVGLEFVVGAPHPVQQYFILARCLNIH